LSSALKLPDAYKALRGFNRIKHMPLRVAVCLHLQAPASLCGCADDAVKFINQNFPLLVCHLVASQKAPAGPIVGNGDQPASVISATHCTLSLCCLRGLCLLV
jgi:hypothetical protein